MKYLHILSTHEAGRALVNLSTVSRAIKGQHFMAKVFCFYLLLVTASCSHADLKQGKGRSSVDLLAALSSSAHALEYILTFYFAVWEKSTLFISPRL